MALPGGRGRWFQAKIAGLVAALPVGVVAAYVLVGVLLWTIPLLNRLHVESSALVAFVAFFAAGFSSLPRFSSGAPFRRVLLQQQAALLIPWGMLTSTLVVVPNCGYLDGLLFYLLFPVVTVVFAVAVAFALVGLRTQRKRRVLAGIGCAIVLIAPLYDLGLHPQFYVYNHVFGGFLGPIYDEELTVGPGLFAFRALTLLWALLAYQIGLRLRRRGVVFSVWMLATVLLIGLAYAFSARLGINTPAWYLREQLGSVYRTEHFDLYYDADSADEHVVHLLAEDHEYRYRWLARRLNAGVSGRIASYLYPDPETKGRLTGARYTNVAPVWLSQPQTHVLLSSYGRAFPHELAHVFTREFGLPVLRASLSVGLVEGTAVALEPPAGLPSVHDQVAAAVLMRSGPVDLAQGGLARELASRLTPFGFWTGRGAVSYTTMGSFVRYLLDAYGAEPLKQVYARGNFDAVYGRPVSELAAEWERHLLSQRIVDRSSGALMRGRFAVPSLFEKECPHWVPRYRRDYRNAARALVAGDSAAALAGVVAALERRAAFLPALELWARLMLAQGEVPAVEARLEPFPADSLTPALTVLRADALVLLGRPGPAREGYDRAYLRYPAYAREERSRVVLRMALVDRPDVLRILVSGLEPEIQAERLAEIDPSAAGECRGGQDLSAGGEFRGGQDLSAGGEFRGGQDPALRLLRALRLLEARQYEQAASLLRTTPPVRPVGASEGELRLMRRQQQVWLARSYYGAGMTALAAEAALDAARLFEAEGDVAEAARLVDYSEKMRWAAAFRSGAPLAMRASGKSITN
jgi:hypothetical protein